MKPIDIKAWVEDRAEQWVEWRLRYLDRSQGTGDSSTARLDQAPGNRDSGGWQWLVCDDASCMAFESALCALPDPLRVVVRMHWLGSECWQLPASGPLERKAGCCGLSVRRYQRLLERAREELYVELQGLTA